VDTSTSYRHEREADLQAASDKLGCHLFMVQLRFWVVSNHAPTAHAKLQALAGALGTFTRSRLATFKTSGITPYQQTNKAKSFLCSHEELATLWHPPVAHAGVAGLQVANFTPLEAPVVLPTGNEAGSVPVGRVDFRQDQREFGIAADDRRRHVHIIGRTGVGKTTLVLNQICSDMQRGYGVGLIDPHGDLAEDVLRRVPRQRTNDVIYFDAADRDYAVGFNPLACTDRQRIDQVTSGAVAAFKKLYSDSWGPRLENTLRNAVFVTVEQGSNLMGLLQLLTEEHYRESVVPKIQDSIVRAFWQHEFASWNKQYRTEAVAAITNKIQPFLTSSSVRAIVSQTNRSLDLRQVMDSDKILIVNLSKGKLGEDNSALLGAFLVTALQQAAMSRADVPEHTRPDFYLYIDEFQNFVTSSFESILSEARKYRLNLTVSHQYRAQLTDTTAAAITGNIGTIIAFAVGSEDAAWLSQAMSTRPDELQPADLSNLPKYTAYVRLLRDGLTRPPFSMTSLPPPELFEDRSRIIIEQSRRQWGKMVV
jgi:Type IV secretion-system coupling protein DNA-binding domain